jgi:hypothetical protein
MSQAVATKNPTPITEDVTRAPSDTPLQSNAPQPIIGNAGFQAATSSDCPEKILTEVSIPATIGTSMDGDAGSQPNETVQGRRKHMSKSLGSVFKRLRISKAGKRG